MILIGLGSNIGDRSEYLRQAIIHLSQQKVHIARISSVIETPALLPDGAPPAWNIPYLNQVIAVVTEKLPIDLLASVKTVEQQMGRVDRGRWSPREIDIDILSYHDEIISGEALTLPHPQMHRREFVLRPIAEIVPDWVHPTLAKTALELLEMAE